MPVSSPPVADGAILIDEQGHIAEAGPDDQVSRPTESLHRHLDGAALMPGLVNTHTHLELTGFAGQVEDDDFRAWINHLIRVKAARSDEAFFVAAQDGIRAGWRSGVTTVCDTGSTGQVIAALHTLGASGAAHHEVFGAHPDECVPAMKAYSCDLDRLARHATGRVQLGLSPHAPYTVSGALYRAASDLARSHGAPMAVHVAVGADESALLRDFTGTFADAWRERAIPRPSHDAVSPIAWLERHGVLGPRTLCIHVIHATDADAELIARNRCAVAHCPRSNRRHHAADARVRRFLDRGIRLGLGTDSEVSVAPPDLFAEARAARLLAGWDAAATVRALTVGGAEALGLDSTIGTLEKGKWADLIAVGVGETTDPEEAVLSAGGGGVFGTWLGGRLVHGGSRDDDDPLNPRPGRDIRA